MTHKLLTEIREGERIFLDSETCGLHGMMVLLQWAVDDGPIHLYNVWREPIWYTLAIIEAMMEKEVVMFNSVFDHFHLCKIYTIFSLCDPDWIPQEHIEEIAMLEPEGQDGPCLKPKSTIDLLLHSRKGPYQSLMARSDIRIRRVPTVLAYALANKLEELVQLDDIYFAKKADQHSPRWKVYDIKDAKTGTIREDFKDVVLKFHPAGGLKFLAEHVLGYKPKFHFKDVEPPKEFRPKEYGYAPTALAVGKPEDGWKAYKWGKGVKKHVGYAWPAVIQKHIDWWADKPDAREYASDDILYTRELWDHFGRPAPDDDDSVLACMVAAVRWHGFPIDVDEMKRIIRENQAKIEAFPINTNKPTEVRAYVTEMMDEMEAIVLQESTKKANLTAVSNWVIDEDEPCHCNVAGHIGVGPGHPHCDEGCKRCGGSGQLYAGPHPASERAKAVLDIKYALKENQMLSKLVRAGKFHASFRVIGTLSSRMSGGDGLNAQGIKGTKEIRSLFKLAWDGMTLCGGDFDSFEVTLADAVYNDPNLREDLLSGKKIHALFGMAIYPGHTYEEIKASDGTDNDMYTKGKSGVFAMIYGGNEQTLVRNLGITEELAIAAFQNFSKRYPGVGAARQKTFDMFCSMRQPDGIGTRVVWADPADYCETFLGYRRYFTLENEVCRTLFKLANSVPREWSQTDIKVMRRDRVQTAGGAVASALYGAAFQMQAANMRAAANHEIQSPGAQITKRVQRMLWDHQPHGAHEFVVAPINIHDEVLTATKPDKVADVAYTIEEGVEHYRDQVPLIGMSWNLEMGSWAGKKATGGVTLKVSPPEMGDIRWEDDRTTPEFQDRMKKDEELKPVVEKYVAEGETYDFYRDQYPFLREGDKLVIVKDAP